MSRTHRQHPNSTPLVELQKISSSSKSVQVSWPPEPGLQKRTTGPPCCSCCHWLGGDKRQTVCEDTLLTQVNSPEGVFLLALCILSRTSMYSCSCFTAVMATASSLIISSSLFWWAETDRCHSIDKDACIDTCRASPHLDSDVTCL